MTLNCQVVVVYNPVGWNRTDIIKIPVSTTIHSINWVEKIEFQFRYNLNEMYSYHLNMKIGKG